jgi:REP element-mobilizing transposase RayT
MKVLAYHITWGTYGTRLHGDPRGTVDRIHNTFKSPVLGFDEHRWENEKSLLKFPPMRFNRAQMIQVESIIPDICARGFWKYHTCAAGPDHVHVIVTSEHDPEKIRRLLKRWTGQALAQLYPLPTGATFWSECGSIRWIDEESYFVNAVNYVSRQRATTIPLVSTINETIPQVNLLLE